MQAVVIYESMFGNTHDIADRIAQGLAPTYEVVVVPVNDATLSLIEGADLLVVGAPTHAHGLPSASSRRSAEQTAARDDDLDLDPAATGSDGLRSWLDGLPGSGRWRAAAFDTRISGPALLTGQASKGIARRLEHHGCALVAEPQSFIVDRHNHLVDGEADRATAWGNTIAALAATPSG